MRALIRRFDGLVRRASGVFEFCDETNCLLRLQVTHAPHDLRLSDGSEVQAGDPVLMLHLWNEHIPPMGPTGPDLAWAAKAYRMLLHSLHAAAWWLANEPRLADVRAIAGVTVLIAPGGERGGLRLMRWLGFDVFPYQGRLTRFGEFWENLYTWWLMWAFNAASLRHRQLLRLRRVEVWTSADAFLKRYRVRIEAKRRCTSVHDTDGFDGRCGPHHAGATERIAGWRGDQRGGRPVGEGTRWPDGTERRTTARYR